MQMTFADMKMRAEYIGGEIKQADADVRESILMRERAEHALDQAREFERKALERAEEKRAERHDLAEAMALYIRSQGEVSSSSVVGADHGAFNFEGVGVFPTATSDAADAESIPLRHIAIIDAEEVPVELLEVPHDYTDLSEGDPR